MTWWTMREEGDMVGHEGEGGMVDHEREVRRRVTWWIIREG